VNALNRLLIRRETTEIGYDTKTVRYTDAN